MPLDIGVGILLALGVAGTFGTEATPFLIAFGIAAALLPDIDILTVPLLGKWYHRTHTHYPIVYVPVAALAYIFLDPVYATLLTLGVYAHLIHDTFGIGWGIAWLWPFSRRKLLFFPAGRRETFGAVGTWMPEEEPPLHEKLQSTDWLRSYFRPSLLAYIEYGTLAVALIALALYFG